jgi:hypothetical protein
MAKLWRLELDQAQSNDAVPQQAGSYRVQVFIREWPVQQVSFMLHITHGPPSKMELDGL